MPERLRGKRVLVTGGLGFIGSNVVHRCLALGASVTVYDMLDPRSGGNMENLRSVENDIRIELNDIRSFEGVSAVIRGHDVLFNCAAYTSHPNSMKEPLIDIDVNCKAVINILEAVKRFNRECKIVHIGTSTQIGRMVFNPVTETHPEFPLDIYSADKSASEKYVLIYGQAYGLRTTCVRLANVFGPRSNIRSADFGFMNYFIGLGLQDKTISVFGEGGQLRTITYVEDVVEALICAAVDDAADGETFFAVGDKQYSVAEIAESIATNVGGRVQYVEWPRDREMI
ncbi:MAG TPA: NAD-dependent epimerase/dehydratase family protein, partial [Thermoanaerobaculia bacterium]|nr:NAD-dependent epimerase/dehydratase family protein [Thermoanaerobaculia bacterium]